MKRNWYPATRRTTHRYNPDYSQLDEWEDLKWDWRILSRHVTEDGEGNYSVTYRIKTSATTSHSDLYSVLSDEFIKGCSCEHDCCGHYFGGLREIKAPRNHRKNEHIAIASYSPNY